MDKKTLYRLFYLPKVIQQKRREIKRIEEFGVFNLRILSMFSCFNSHS